MIVRHSHRWTKFLPIEIRGYIQQRLDAERKDEAAQRAEEFKRYRHTRAIKGATAAYRDAYREAISAIDPSWGIHRRNLEHRNACKDAYLAMYHYVVRLAHDRGVSLDLVNNMLRVVARINETDAVVNRGLLAFSEPNGPVGKFAVVS